MSQSDREVSKCGRSAIKEGEGSDLSLSGSQVSLISRPRSVMGKASVRALSVSGPRVRRPMSAVPSMSYLEIPRDKRRPYSADSQPVLRSYQQKRNKLASCYSISIDPMGLSNHDIETDGDMEFSSSTLVSSQLSDQLGGSWMELEMQGLYLGHSDRAQHSCSTDNGSDLFCCSDASEEPTRSEKSLGERIQAMARDHVHNDPCNETTSDGVKITSERSANDDPKKMSTKELHLRMVESGLIPASLPYTSSCGHENVDKVKSQLCSNQDISSSMRSFPKDDVKRSSCEDIGDGSKVETTSREIWNQPNEFLKSLNKSTCSIDQISYPKEHDVDSLEGESGSNHSDRDLQRKGDNILKSKQVHSEQESPNDTWANTDLVPVRFQQWMMEYDQRNGSMLNELSGSYFCGVRHINQQDEKNKPSPDCTIEEVSVDSEYCKAGHTSEYKSEKASEHCVSGLQSDVSYFEPILSAANVKPSLSEDVQEDIKWVEKQDNQTDGTSVNGLYVKPVSFELENTSVRINQEGQNSQMAFSDPIKYDTSQSYNSENFELKDTSINSRSFGLDTDKKSSDILKGAGCSKGAKKPSTNAKRNPVQKRRTACKGDGSIRKGLLRSPSNRNVSQPEEECLPEESQPELLSWMAMCSDESQDQQDSHQYPFQRELRESSSDDKNEGDSPYNEIMTILRVLEEKEDESSLMTILNKRSAASSEKTDTNINNNISSSSKAGNSILSESSSDFQPNDTFVSRPPSASFKTTLDAHKIDWMEDKSHEKCEVNNTSHLNSVNLSCASNDAHIPQQVQGELKDLITFLDAVDQSCTSALEPKLSSNPRSSPEPVDSHNVEELLLMGRSDLAQEIVSLRLALEDRDATINLLRTALREQKDNHARQNTAHTKELETRLSQVKTECESAIKRHQKFIDQLIADKASLSERCESLVQAAKENEEKHAKSLSHLEQKHKVEMQRAKDITAATEKLKRERWVENKTQKIKELTVRGLEPELTRLTAQHEQEMSALRTLHAQELEQMELRAARRASQQMETLREQLVQEKEEALARERDILRQRMEKQQLLFEEEGAEQRRRLVAEVRREQDRLATLEARLEAQLEDRKRALEREAELNSERFRRDYADKLNEMHRKQQNEILLMREALKAEKESWIETYQQQQKQAFVQTTNEVRDQLKRERDREIEVVIERLEHEATISREEREKAAENRLRRVREQLTSELKDVESALNALKEKHFELRALVQEKEDKLVSSETLNRSLQTQLVETRKIADQLSAERADLKQALRNELNNEMENLKQQLTEENLRHQQQMRVQAEQAERERQTHQQELQQLYDRVKLAIAKKEEVVKAAKAKQRAVEDQNSHLQALLEHRRKESFLS